MSRQVWKGSTLLNPEPPVLVSCGSPARRSAVRTVREAPRDNPL